MAYENRGFFSRRLFGALTLSLLFAGGLAANSDDGNDRQHWVGTWSTALDEPDIVVPGKTGPATWHFEARQTLYVSSPGDFTASAVLPLDSATPGALAWFWLAGVDVAASGQTGAIVAFGDSIIDGTQSTVDANNR